MRSTSTFKYILLVFQLLLAGSVLATIGEGRKFQLDSITTNVDKSIKKDLGKVHSYLHAQGKNDEERVWMFYGFIATHFKYDHERKNDHDRADYSNGYTAKKMSGVCEDFANLFKELCDRSNIPCLVVTGKGKSRFLAEAAQAIGRFFRRQSNKVDHAWNIVKIDTAWKLMDPTWSRVLRVEKRQVYDVKQKRNVSVSIKIPDRNYYDKDPELMKKDHKPAHPAFYASTGVPTFKTGFKKEKRRKPYMDDYNFSAIIDSIYKDEYPMFSKVYLEGAKQYLHMSFLRYSFSRELVLPTQKTAAPVTIEEYEANLKYVHNLSRYIHKTYTVVLDAEVREYEMIVNKKIQKLKKLQEQQKPKGRVAAKK